MQDIIDVIRHLVHHSPHFTHEERAQALAIVENERTEPETEKKVDKQ